MRVFNLICVRKAEVKEEDLILTDPISEIVFPKLPDDFSFEILFSFTDWKADRENKLKVCINQPNGTEVFNSEYLEVPIPISTEAGILSFRLNDFDVQELGAYDVSIYEDEVVIANTLFIVREMLAE